MHPFRKTDSLPGVGRGARGLSGDERELARDHQVDHGVNPVLDLGELHGADGRQLGGDPVVILPEQLEPLRFDPEPPLGQGGGAVVVERLRGLCVHEGAGQLHALVAQREQLFLVIVVDRPELRRLLGRKPHDAVDDRDLPVGQVVTGRVDVRVHRVGAPAHGRGRRPRIKGGRRCGGGVGFRFIVAGAAGCGGGGQRDEQHERRNEGAHHGSPQFAKRGRAAYGVGVVWKGWLVRNSRIMPAGAVTASPLRIMETATPVAAPLPPPLSSSTALPITPPTAALRAVLRNSPLPDSEKLVVTIGWMRPLMSTPLSENASSDLPASRPACLDLSTCPYTADPDFATVTPLAARSASSLLLIFLPAGSL